MKKIFMKLLLLFLLSNSLMGQDTDLIKEIRQNAVADGSPIRMLIEEQIKKHGKADVDLYTGSLYADGIMIQQALLPVVQMYQGKVNFNMHYFEVKSKDQGVGNIDQNPEYQEDLRQVTVANVYPNLFVDYLLMRGESMFGGDPVEIMKKLGFEKKKINGYLLKNAPALLEASVKGVIKKYPIQDVTILVIGGKEIEVKLEDFIHDYCYDFFKCMNACSNAAVGHAILGFWSCYVCAGNPIPANPACGSCGLQGAGLASILGCRSTCLNDPDLFSSATYNHRCNGPDKYCVEVEYDQTFQSENIETVHCVPCASEEENIIITPNGIEFFLPEVYEPGIEFYGYFILQDPKPDIRYDLKVIVNSQCVGYTGNSPLDYFYGIQRIQYLLDSINIGDEVKMEITPQGLASGCPALERTFQFECPEIEIIPNFDNNTFQIAWELGENSPFQIDVYMEEDTVGHNDMVLSQRGFNARLPSGVTPAMNFDPNRTYNFRVITRPLVGSTAFTEFFSECNQNIDWIPKDCETQLSVTDIDLNNDQEWGAIIFSISEDITDPVDWTLRFEDGSLIDSALNSTEPFYFINDLREGNYVLKIEGACTERIEFEIEHNCSNFAGCNTPFTLNATAKDATAANQSNGYITFTNQGLTYFWSDLSGASYNGNRLGLPPGHYCVDAYDANCCHAQACYDIGPSCDLNVYYAVDAACENEHNGAIQLFVSGGTPAYTYQWSNGETADQLFKLSAGDYQVTVTDKQGCQQVLEMTVPNLSDQVSIETNFKTNTIEALFSGSITNLTWTGPGINVSNENSPILHDIPNGVYCLTVETGQGCQYTECINFALPLDITLTPTICGDFISGEPNTVYVTVEVTGGTGNYSYEWTNIVEQIGNAVVVEIGTEYCVTVTDDDPVEPLTGTLCETIPDLSVAYVASQVPCPGKDNGSICVQGIGGAPPYRYQWVTNPVPTESSCSLPNLAGDDTYVVTVTDDCGNTATFSHFLAIDYTSPSVTNVDIESACETSANGSLFLEVEGGSEIMEYIWSRPPYFTRTTTEPVLTEVRAGDYYLTIKDACGETELGPFTIAAYENDDLQIYLEWDISPDCLNNYSPDASVTLANPEENGDLTFEWSNGDSGPVLTNLEAGIYYVTATLPNGCSKSEIVIVTFVGDFLESSIVQPSCKESGNGSIELVMGPGDFTFSWSNGQASSTVSYLETGTHTVTITEINTGCVEVEEFVIEDGNNDPDFEYEVVANTYFNNANGGNASVSIFSEFFEEWGKISLDGIPVDPRPTLDHNDDGNIHAIITIPYTYQDNASFDFTYISPNGCELHGTFDALPSCIDMDPNAPGMDDLFVFVPLLDADEDAVCNNAGGTNGFNIAVTHAGPNPPYYIEVSMIEAFDDPVYLNYTATYLYDGQAPFLDTDFPHYMYIEGVPNGIVQFKSYSNCERRINSVVQSTCCYDISCEILSEGPTEVGDGGYVYHLNFLDLNIHETCYDDHCGDLVHDSDCSEVVPELITTALADNCWYGRVTIDYPTGPDAVFVVFPDDSNDGIDVYDEIEWIEEVSWMPESPDTYTITVTYEGEDHIGSGVDCVQEIEVDFYGSGNYSDAVGFNDDFWFHNSHGIYPEEAYDNSYHGVWRCNNCSEPGEYIFENDQRECEEEFNWQFTYFNYSPVDFNNPCNSGGLLTLIDFNENGEAVLQTVNIASNTAIEDFPGHRAFEQPNNQMCNSGWCLFDGNAIYGINDFDKPILATWYDPSTCIDFPDEIPFCDEDNPCVFGNCVDGQCEENSDDCYPPCPDDHECIDNVCVLSVPVSCFDNCDCPDYQYCDDGECMDIPGGLECTEPCHCPEGYECVGGECLFFCVDACDCPENQYCNGGECEDSPSNTECTDHCQCPEDYLCVNDVCIFDAQYPNCNEDHPCPSGEFCDDGTCTDCPTINITACYGNPSCISVTDCLLDILVSSTTAIQATIEVRRSGQLVNTHNTSLGSNLRHLIERVPNDCVDYFYTVTVIFDGCNSTTVAVYPGGVNCAPTAGGCFTGGGQDVIRDSAKKSKGGTKPKNLGLSTNEVSDKDLENPESRKCFLYPNPFADLINVEYQTEKSEKITIVIADIYGRKIQEASEEVVPGLNKTQVELNTNLAIGIYYVTITNEAGESESFKMLHADFID